MQVERPLAARLTALPDTVSSTSVLGRTSSARAMFICPGAALFLRCLRSKLSFLSSTVESESDGAGWTKVTKLAAEMFDLPESGMKKEELPAVVAVTSMLTPSLSPRIRARPEA